MTQPLKVGFLFSAVEIGNGPFDREQDVVLLPDGHVKLKDGTSLIVDRAGIARVKAAFEKHGVDVPFDVNHATVLKLPKGEEAPAYGWGNKLWYEPGRGLMCHVKWTEEGFEQVKSQRYRYLSPVVGYEEATGQVRMIHSAALTTKPATPGMPALAATDVFCLQKENDSMDGLLKKMLQEGEAVVATAEQKMGELKALLESKGAELGDGVDFVGILNAAIASLKGEGKSEDEEKPAETPAAAEDTKVAATVRVELGQAANADASTVLRALSELTGHVGYVPHKEHKRVLERVTALENAELTRKSDELVQTCLTEGKLLETDAVKMEWAKAFARRDADGFKIVMANAPAIVPQGRTTPPPGNGGPTNLDGAAEEKLMAKALSDHGGNHKAAMIALQTELMAPHAALGLTKKAARERCEQQYPKIFG